MTAVPLDATMPNQPFFIVGAPRSGTTLLRMMLNAHPNVCVPPESHFVVEVFDQLGGQFTLEDASAAVRAHPRFREWELPWSEVEEALARRGGMNEGWALFFDAIFGAYADREGKPRWADKTPGYARRLDVLHAIFPQATIVHLVRDGRDVAVSLARMPWFEGGWFAGAQRWKHDVEKARRNGQRLFGDRYVEVRYEELVRDALQVLSLLSAKLDLPMNEAMLAYYERGMDELPAHRHAWHARVGTPPDESATGQWRDALPATERAALETMLARTLRPFGYDAKPSRSPAVMVCLLRHRLGLSESRRVKDRSESEAAAAPDRASEGAARS